VHFLFYRKEDACVEDWRDLKRMVKALAGVARLTIIYHLARTPEMTVTDLVGLLNVSQPLVSWHLRTLRRAGLIKKRNVGRQAYYSLNTQRFQLCLQHLERLVDPAIHTESLLMGLELIAADADSEE
jgi:ArsR family transcriptional regulator, arsenate/arsenite/antimonite-responsive transcriptional repressor